MLINALRGHLAGFGIVRACGLGGVKAAIEVLHEAQNGLPELARVALHGLVDQLRTLASTTRTSMNGRSGQMRRTTTAEVRLDAGEDGALPRLDAMNRPFRPDPALAMGSTVLLTRQVDRCS